MSINNLPAARAHTDTVGCDEHSDSPKIIAHGSMASWRVPGTTVMTAWVGGLPSWLRSMARSSRSASSGKG
ncbi:hypothetical protein D3C78_520170 [compost metagenome]